MAIKVMLVDDHKMLNEGIKQLLEFDSEIDVYFQAFNGKECIDELSVMRPDVVLLDINLPDINGIKVLKEIKKKSKKIKVLMLTVHNEPEYLLDAIDNEADGYLLKDSGSEDLIRAVKAVYHGEQYIDTSLVPMLNARLIQRENDSDMVKDITKRERQILIAIAEGKNNLAIGKEFNISEQTVKNHISNLFKKIGVKDRTQAAVFAIRNNIVHM